MSVRRTGSALVAVLAVLALPAVAACSNGSRRAPYLTQPAAALPGTACGAPLPEVRSALDALPWLEIALTCASRRRRRPRRRRGTRDRPIGTRR